MSVLESFFPLAVIIVITSVLVFVVLTVSRILGPFRPTSRKLMPYESGMDPIGPAQRRIPVRFYLVAVSFIIFDIEVIFFLPWAVRMRELGVYGLLTMGFFVIVLIVGFVYEWKRGGLEWE